MKRAVGWIWSVIGLSPPASSCFAASVHQPRLKRTRGKYVCKCVYSFFFNIFLCKDLYTLRGLFIVREWGLMDSGSKIDDRQWIDQGQTTAGK